MVVVFDAGMLSILIHPEATVPDDPSTGKTLAFAKERIEHLVDTLAEDRSTIVIPTPALAEFLVVVDESGASYLRLIGTYACFDIQPFDLKAAIECAESQRKAFAAGDKKSGAEGSYQKSKVDRQIVSVAKAVQADLIYTTDKDVVKIARFEGLKSVPVWDLPLPAPGDEAAPESEPDSREEEVDGKLPFVEPDEESSESTVSSLPIETVQPSAQSHGDVKPTMRQPAPDPPSGPPAAPEPQQRDSSQTVVPPPRSEK